MSTGRNDVIDTADVEIGEDHAWVESLSEQKDAEKHMISHTRQVNLMFCLSIHHSILIACFQKQQRLK